MPTHVYCEMDVDALSVSLHRCYNNYNPFIGPLSRKTRLRKNSDKYQKKIHSLIACLCGIIQYV